MGTYNNNNISGFDLMARRQKKVFSYIRFSSGSQSFGSSEERQRIIFEEALEEKYIPQGYVFAKELVDRGDSGFHAVNIHSGSLGEFIELAKEGKKVKSGDLLAIESIDRFGRDNAIKAIRRLAELICDYRVTVDFLDRKWIPPLNEETLEENLEQIVNECKRARQESQRRSDLISGATTSKRKEIRKGKVKYTSLCPAWLKPITKPIEGTVKTQVVGYKKIPDNIKAVRRIYKLALGGMGAHKIINQLNEENIPAITKKGKWAISYIQKVLRWPAVLGIYQPQKTKVVKGITKYIDDGAPIKDYYGKGIITENDFYSLQRMKKGYGKTLAIGKNREKNETEFLFSGILRCGYGQGVVAAFRQSKTNNGESYYYPKQIKQRAKLKGDIANGWDVVSFEKFFAQMVSDLDWGIVLDAAQKQNKQLEFNALDGVEGRLDDIDKQIKNCVDAIALTGLADELQKKIHELQNEKTNLIIELESEKDIASKLGDGTDFAAFVKMQKAKKEITKKKFRKELILNIRARIESIEVYGNGWQWNKKTFNDALEWLDPEWKADYMDCNQGNLPKYDEKLFPNLIVPLVTG